MKRWLTAQVALSTFVLSAAGGCAYLGHVGLAIRTALKIGGDTYQASSPPASPERGGETARRMALTAANKKCESMGKEPEVTSTTTEFVGENSVVLTVTFKCK
jgi:hypothetical protein